MTKEELGVLVTVCDASINKGGVISPEAMLIVASARRSAINTLEKMKDGERLVPEKKIDAIPSESEGAGKAGKG